MSSPTTIRQRVDRVAAALRSSGVTAVLVSPGPDLRYLLDYDAVPLERLTCLVIPASGNPVLVVPRLEEAAARASGAGGAIAANDLDLRVWDETEDPYALVAAQVRERCPEPLRIAVDDRMWAAKAIALRAAIPGCEQIAAGRILSDTRRVKDPDEIAALEEAAQAIDRVHARVPGLLRIGRSEREIAADIAAAIIDEGHVRVDFVIVAAGPNSASPHHEPTDRVIGEGEPIVVDIGGTMPSGYCSDETRMYAVGAPDGRFLDAFALLETAQADAVAGIVPGATAGDIDRIARDSLARGALDRAFIHRTGHGIGLETHEEPYIMDGSEVTLEPGMVFSVEPGFYLADRYGARIEDIVVVTDSGARSLTERPRGLVVVPVDGPGAGA